MWFGYVGSGAQTLVPVPVERVADIRNMNRQGILPDDLIDSSYNNATEILGYTNGAGVV